MKKIITLILAGVLAVSMVACSAPTEEAAAPTEDSTAPASESTEESTEETTEEEPATAGTVVIQTVNATDELIDVEYMLDPQRIVVLNYQTLDFLDAMGLGDRIVGTIGDPTMSEHLVKYYEDPDIVQLGGMKDYDLEAVMSLQPDVIFSSDRTASHYDDLSVIAPVFCAFVDYEAGYMNSYKDLAARHSAMFGLTDEVDTIIAGYEERIAAINAFATEGEVATALLGLVTGGEYNALGNGGRCSIITNEMGFNNLDADQDVNHGDIASTDLILQQNPDYLFVLDKDVAVGDEVSTTAEDLILGDQIIQQTTAYQNENIVFLTPGNNWYLVDGGITALDAMIKCIEDAIA